MEKIDDGSLSFLGIPPDEDNRFYNCPETTQQKLVNTTFWIVGYLENIKTKHGSGRFLVKIKHRHDDPESLASKFFTNSREIKYVLQRIKELNAFPRKVTMRASGNRYYLE